MKGLPYSDMTYQKKNARNTINWKSLSLIPKISGGEGHCFWEPVDYCAKGESTFKSDLVFSFILTIPSANVKYMLKSINLFIKGKTIKNPTKVKGCVDRWTDKDHINHQKDCLLNKKT